MQRLVKRTRWSDDVSRVDLLLSFLSSRRKKALNNVGNSLYFIRLLRVVITEKTTRSINRMKFRLRGKIILHHLIKLHAFMGNVANALPIIEKRCNAF